ncbi:carbohydrate kinase [Oceanivirga miroungae]|uniref:Ribokinase n=1 Tax=Oceanivirga miroungae TaxID=1130046 RepID=A0A6I8M9F1_9FUSO|nr:carbohydrate kinase [Oceanivirga miroungae]VWL84898.1 ribokinase [Oceanivirga miroungae]
MTKQERKIYSLIKENPSISQKEIAEILNLTRAAVAVHISHITEKGYILGRQYIVKKNKQVLVIGACNVDMQGFANDNFELYNSNMGKIKITFGGVGRNIAVNLNKLCKNTKMLTVLSKDKNGIEVLNDLIRNQINVEDILTVNENMSTYLSIFNTNSEMIAAISDMGIIKNLSVEYLKTKEDLIKKAEIIVIDTNIPKDSIEYIASKINSKAKLIVDTVSIEKASKINGILDKITVLKTNKLELEAIAGVSLNKVTDIKKAAIELLKKGVKKIFVTLGPDGLVYGDINKLVKISSPKKIEVVDVNGAGDIFTSALIYAENLNLSLGKMAKFAQSAAIFKLSKLGTSPEDFSLNSIKEVAKKHFPEISKGDFFYE